MNQNIIPKIVIAVLLAVVVLGGGSYIFYTKKQKANALASLPIPIVINLVDQPIKGDKNAKNTIVSVEDFKCPNCRRFNNEILPWVTKEYIDTHKANYSLLSVAFISGSITAANAARCLYSQNSDYFFQFADILFQNQGLETENWTTTTNLLELSSQVPGADQNQLASCMIANQYHDKIMANTDQAFKMMNNTLSTPAVYINGVAVKPLTKEQFELVFENVAN